MRQISVWDEDELIGERCGFGPHRPLKRRLTDPLASGQSRSISRSEPLHWSLGQAFRRSVDLEAYLGRDSGSHPDVSRRGPPTSSSTKPASEPYGFGIRRR